MKERGPGRSRAAADRRYQSRLNKCWDELKWLYLISSVVSVMANIAAYIVTKWIDKHEP